MQRTAHRTRNHRRNQIRRPPPSLVTDRRTLTRPPLRPSTRFRPIHMHTRWFRPIGDVLMWPPQLPSTTSAQDRTNQPLRHICSAPPPSLTTNTTLPLFSFRLHLCAAGASENAFSTLAPTSTSPGLPSRTPLHPPSPSQTKPNMIFVCSAQSRVLILIGFIEHWRTNSNVNHTQTGFSNTTTSKSMCPPACAAAAMTARVVR